MVKLFRKWLSKGPKGGSKMDIEFSGMDLSEKEKYRITNIISGYSRKNHTQLFHINIKKEDKSGRRSRYIVDLNVSTEFGRFSAEDSSWRLSKSIREAIKKIEKQVTHAMGKRA